MCAAFTNKEVHKTGCLQNDGAQIDGKFRNVKWHDTVFAAEGRLSDNQYSEFLLRIAQRDETVVHDKNLLASVSADKIVKAKLIQWLNNKEQLTDPFAQKLHLTFQETTSLCKEIIQPAPLFSASTPNFATPIGLVGSAPKSIAVAGHLQIHHDCVDKIKQEGKWMGKVQHQDAQGCEKPAKTITAAEGQVRTQALDLAHVRQGCKAPLQLPAWTERPAQMESEAAKVQRELDEQLGKNKLLEEKIRGVTSGHMTTRAMSGSTLQPADTPRALEAIETLLHVSDTSGEAHATLGWQHMPSEELSNSSLLDAEAAHSRHKSSGRGLGSQAIAQTQLATRVPASATAPAKPSVDRATFGGQPTRKLLTFKDISAAKAATLSSNKHATAKLVKQGNRAVSASPRRAQRPATKARAIQQSTVHSEHRRAMSASPARNKHDGHYVSDSGVLHSASQRGRRGTYWGTFSPVDSVPLAGSKGRSTPKAAGLQRQAVSQSPQRDESNLAIPCASAATPVTSLSMKNNPPRAAQHDPHRGQRSMLLRESDSHYTSQCGKHRRALSASAARNGNKERAPRGQPHVSRQGNFSPAKTNRHVTGTTISEGGSGGVIDLVSTAAAFNRARTIAQLVAAENLNVEVTPR